MKIIFLDIDGVLNNTASFVFHKFQREKNGAKTFALANPDPLAVHLLDRLMDGQDDIGIVVSSSWRKAFPSVAQLQDVLRDDFGLRHWRKIIGLTPTRDDGFRGKEIVAWMQANGQPEQFLILDDDSDFLESQKLNFVQTIFDRGFGWPEYEKAKTILRIKKKELVL